MMKKQDGVALFIALILLAVLMVIGVASVRNSTFQEKMSINLHQLNSARAAADTGFSAFLNLTESQDRTADDSILQRMRLSGVVDFCVSSDGTETEVGNDDTCLDTPVDGQAIASARVTVTNKGCDPTFCIGYSQGGSFACRGVLVTTGGNAAGMASGVEWHGFEVTSFCGTGADEAANTSASTP
ncbi:pilus assembly PilX family protein [Pleionea sediminis]|uniref:pilus assembly PilX family protein n=1 Tax=Pleionea sediminis TaxID=2569479 RepID=UPI001185DC92|nr:pilus assembly PilX N-terminal domain-containing protein [Pleionea sediminis]